MACNASSHSLYHVRYLSTLLYKVDPAIGFIQPGSTNFKDSTTLAPKLADPPFWWKSNSTPSKSGSGLPNLDRLICCTIQRCLLFKIQLLRNQISLGQHVFSYIYNLLWWVSLETKCGDAKPRTPMNQFLTWRAPFPPSVRAAVRPGNLKIRQCFLSVNIYKTIRKRCCPD